MDLVAVSIQDICMILMQNVNKTKGVCMMPMLILMECLE